MENIHFSIHLAIPKIKTIWLKDHSVISPQFIPIFKAFNEYQLGIYEQALFNYYKPQLNSQLQCKFTFLTWFD